MTLIEARNIKVKLNEVDILKGVDFQLNSGEIVGLIGPNGAGKSTLIKTIIGLIRHNSGSVQLMGRERQKMSQKEIAKAVGYLPQGQTIHWPLSSRRIVSLGRMPHRMPWQDLNQKDEQAVTQAMTDTDCGHLSERPVDRLAGGERALVLLARVLAMDPPVILADEPVSGLDPNHEIQVMQLLKNLAEKGHGVVVVLHNLTLAARFCHRLFLMHEGWMMDAGSPEKVLSEENLKKSYGVRAKYGNHEGAFYVIPWSRLGK